MAQGPSNRSVEIVGEAGRSGLAPEARRSAGRWTPRRLNHEPDQIQPISNLV